MANPWEEYAPQTSIEAGPWSDYGGKAAADPEPPKPPTGAQRLGAALNNIPRQLGLTARYALEGPAIGAQVITEPLRYATDRLTGMTGRTKPLGAVASEFADTLGLPKPANDLERVVGEGTKLGFGAMAGSGAAQAADGVLNAGRTALFPAIGTPQTLMGRVSDAARTTLPSMAANPGAQVAGAAGAGAAGQLSKEAGGGPWQQAGASLLGGLAGNFGAQGLGAGLDAVKQGVSRLSAPAMAPQTLDIRITNLLANEGVDFSKLAPQAQAALRQDVQRALTLGDQLDETALARLAAFRSAGMTPTRGMISQNPIDITREQNLSKTAANMATGDAAQVLPMLQNQNNAAAIGRLNDLGAGAGVLPVDAGRTVTGAIGARNAANEATERAAWNTARNSPGFTQPIYPDALSAMNRALGDEGLMPFMSPGVSRYIEALQTNPGQFTPQSYANLRSMLSAELAKGGNEARAARTAINAMEAAPMRPITGTHMDIGQAPITQQTATLLNSADRQAGDAIQAVDAARRATAQKYGYQDSNALVRSALADARSADPKRIADSFIIGGTADEARLVANEVGPEGVATIKNAIANHIKQQALSGASDETGKASAAALTKTLNKIGDEKLGVFFSPQEVAELKALDRALSLSLSQPRGSAVNNSNTAAMLVGKTMDALSRFGEAIPFAGPLAVGPLRQGVQNVQVTLGNAAAQNVPRGLLAAAPAPTINKGLAPLVIPSALSLGGLLAAQPQP